MKTSRFLRCILAVIHPAPRSLPPAGGGGEVKGQTSGKSHWLRPLLALCCMVNAVTADQFGFFTYTDNGKSISIDGYTGAGGAVAIPASIVGKPVTSIGDWAFSGCIDLTGVTIPPGVTSIGDWAFASCRSLTSVTITSGVTSIADHAFFDCPSLTSVTLPNGVTTIGQYAFSYCTSLTTASFMGNAPPTGPYSFPSGVTVYYRSGALGFIKPYWPVAFPGEAPQFTSPAPPATGRVGTAYHHACAAGNAPAPAFSVTSGALPPGLTLSIAGMISGRMATASRQVRHSHARAAWKVSGPVLLVNNMMII